MSFLNEFWNALSGRATEFSFITLLAAVLKIAVTVFLAQVLIRVINKVIRATLEHKAQKHPNSTYEKKQHTLMTLFRSITKYGIYFFMVICILDIMGLGSTVGSVIATAGIGGIALSLGAQSLIADIVAGFFNLFEDSFAVGDYIKLPTLGLEGTVESVALRTTRLKLVNGEIAIINNGTLGTIINFTRNSYTLILDYTIAGDADDAQAGACIEATMQRYFAEKEYDAKTVKYLGLAAVTPMKKTLRFLGEVPPLQHWQTERDLNKAVLTALERAGIARAEAPEVIVKTAK